MAKPSGGLREPPIHFYSLYGTKGVVENNRTGWDRTGLLYTEEDCGKWVDMPLFEW